MTIMRGGCNGNFNFLKREVFLSHSRIRRTCIGTVAGVIFFMRIKLRLNNEQESQLMLSLIFNARYVLSTKEERVS